MKKLLLILSVLFCVALYADTKYRVYTPSGYTEFRSRLLAVQFYNNPNNQATGFDTITFTPPVDTTYSPFNNDSSLIRIRQTARGQNIVGTRDDSLTNAQLNTIIKLLMWKKGAFDNNGRVKPFRDWLDN